MKCREGKILKGRHADEVMRQYHGLHELETRKLRGVPFT
jgi:hypothetical protein